MNENLKPVEKLTPFTKMIMTIGTLPSSFYASMSYYESMVWLYEYLKNQVIPAVNNNAEAVEELQTAFIELKEWTETYTEETIPAEINRKLDEMATDGTLQSLIDEIMKYKGLQAFNNVNDLKNSPNLINGSYAQTLGYYEINDGGQSLYKIRTKTILDIPNEMNLIEINDELIAELIINEKLNIKQFGAYGDNTHDDTLIFNTAINYCKNNYKLYINEGIYKITDVITLPEDIIIEGANKQWNISSSNTGSQLNLNNDAYILTNGYINLSNLLINGTGLTNTNKGIELKGGRGFIHNITLMNFEKAITNSTETINLTRFENITITNCKYAIDLSNGDSGTSSNSQSLSFINIDIRECWYGYISNAPSNKFFNFCVQDGITGNNDGYAIKLLSGSNNNFFYGTYLENANYTYEIICENGAKLNSFNGNRILPYASHINDLDGTNIFVGTFTQFNRNIDIGEKYFTKLGVAYGDSSKGFGLSLEPSSDSEFLLDINGTSQAKFLTATNKIILKPDIQLNGRYIITSLPYCGQVTATNRTILAGETLLITSSYFDHPAKLVFGNVSNQTNLAVVNCNGVPNSNTININVKNIGSTDFSGDIKIDIIIFY